MAKASTKVEDKKTVTVEISIKKWQKMALLSIVLLIASYMMVSCAHAQSSGTVVECTPTGGCYYTTHGISVTSVSSPSVSSDVSISHATIGSSTVNTLMVGNCIYSDGTPCQTKEKPKSDPSIKVVFFIMSIIVGIGAFGIWFDQGE